MNPFPKYAQVRTEKTVEFSKRGRNRVFLSLVETDGLRFMLVQCHDPEPLCGLFQLKPHKADSGLLSVQVSLFDSNYEPLKPSQIKREFSSVFKNLENLGYRVR